MFLPTTIIFFTLKLRIFGQNEWLLIPETVIYNMKINIIKFYIF
jgi:hypothetical protein